MKHFRKLIVGFAAVVVTSSLASPGFAKPSYSCRSDKAIDNPMQFNYYIESGGNETQKGGRVRLSAFGGSDKSGWVAPNNNGAWQVYRVDGSGAMTLVTRFTQSLLVFSSTELLKEASVEGLLPGAYVIRLTSMDLCGNRGYMQRTINLASPDAESTKPNVSAPELKMVGSFGATTYTLYFTATDDTGIRRLTVEVNGNRIADYTYFDGTSYRWWTAFYPEDSALTAFEGPSFSIGYSDQYKGQCGVRVTAEDVWGNQTTVDKNVCLP